MESKLWYDRYAPRTLSECILPSGTRQQLEKMIETKEIPNLLLSGSAGIGKTTAAKVLLDSIGAEYILIPSSLKGNIDTLRNEIQQFASSIALNGERKYVILDEADNLSSATQLAMRGFIDEFTHNCGFIFTCNFREKILAPIAESRLEEVSFTFKSEEKGLVARGIYDKLVEILKNESVSYEDKTLKTFIVDYLKKSSDLRYLLLQAQKASRLGNFDPTSINSILNQRIVKLIESIKAKNFVECRTWIGENSDIEPERVFRELYDNAKEVVGPKMVGPLVLIIADYQFKNAFVADREINLAACMVQIMTECL